MSFFQLRSPYFRNVPPVGGAVNASIAQVAAVVTASGGTQTIDSTARVAITQLAATVTAGGGIQVVASQISISVAQVAATVTASGGTQTVATVNNVAITQVAGVVTVAGGTQALAATASVSLAQAAATVTASGGTQAIATVRKVAITQVGGVVTAAGGTQVATAHTNSLQNNVVDYYKLDDASGSTAVDSVGGNDGTWQGTLGSQWGTGKLHGDGVFNGTDNYILVGDVASLSFGTGVFTLSAWVKATASTRQTIINKYLYTGTSVESGYYIDMLAGGNLRAVYETTNANLRNTDSSITINDGNWHLVVAVRPSTTGEILLYIDGVLDPSVTHAFSAGTPGNIDNTIPFAIGQSIVPSLGITDWSGQIDEVGIWNRDLTSIEVTSLYNSGVGQQYPFGNTAVIQTAATVTASGGTQIITTGSVVNASIAQVAATVTASGGTQTVTTVNIVAISQVAGVVTAGGGTQVVATVRNVALAQTAGVVTATGGTQVVAAVQKVALAQVAGVVTAGGGTQAVSGSVVASSVNLFALLGVG